MYYTEKIIDGVLCCKTSPQGQYRPLSARMLTRRIEQLTEELKMFKESEKFNH